MVFNGTKKDFMQFIVSKYAFKIDIEKEAIKK